MDCCCSNTSKYSKVSRLQLSFIHPHCELSSRYHSHMMTVYTETIGHRNAYTLAGQPFCTFRQFPSSLFSTSSIYEFIPLLELHPSSPVLGSFSHSLVWYEGVVLAVMSGHNCLNLWTRASAWPRTAVGHITDPLRRGS